jgi:hypothetical protein
MRKLYVLAFYIMYVFCGTKVLAQQVKEHSKGSYVDSLNRYYHQASLPVYIYVSHSPDKPPTQLSNTDDPKSKNELKPIYLDGHGKHHLHHFDDIDKKADNFIIYADGLSPKSTLRFTNSPHYLVAGRHYYGKNTGISLSASDEMSGVEGIYHSLNGAEYALYAGSLQFSLEGEQSYSFYAVDRVGNVEKPQAYTFVVDLKSPATYHTIVGLSAGNIISAGTKLLLKSEDNLAGVSKIFFRLDDEKDRQYDGGNLPFAVLPDGEHTLTYYAVDQVANTETPQSFTFYLDKIPPIMTADVLGDKFIVNDQVYFSGRTKLKLTAVDNKSGIKEILFSVDGEEYKQYGEPFYLPNKAGAHIVRYYAIDNMENEGAGNRKVKFNEYKHLVNSVYVDLTGPALSFDYVGKKFQKGDSIFINHETQIKLSAVDPESGLQYISYSLDGGENETRYDKPFSLTEIGAYKVNYFGYDNVNNRNASDFVFVVDRQGPDVLTTFSISPNKVVNNIPVYPSYVTLFLAATDTQTGFEEIRYSVNGAKEKVYTGMIQGFEKGKEYSVMVSATDKLGNPSKTEIKFRIDEF